MAQGSVISSILFIFFVASYPESVEPHAANADDMHAAHSSTRLQETADDVTPHAESVGDKAEKKTPNFST